MNQNVIALIVFAVVAVVILVNLYNVLGRKIGFRAEEKPANMKVDGDGDVTVRTERLTEAPRMPNLEALKTRDVNFNEINFLEKARETYEQVVIAFHKGELDAIKDRLSERVMQSFRQVVDNRAEPPKEIISFVDQPKADLDLIEFKDDVAQIRVRFLSELLYEEPVVEAVAEVVEAPETAPVKKTTKKTTKQPEKVEPAKPHRTYKRTAEYWTFQKSMKTTNSPWLLTRVEAAKA